MRQPGRTSRPPEIKVPDTPNRVEALIRALGLSDGPPLPQTPPAGSDGDGRQATVPGVDAAARRQVLERLARKEITADDAAALLRGEQPAAKTGTKAAEAAADDDSDPEEDTTIVRLEDA